MCAQHGRSLSKLGQAKLALTKVTGIFRNIRKYGIFSYISALLRGYDNEWRKASAVFLKANVVDHIVPQRGDKKLFWDKNNWQALCKVCHDKKQ